MLCGNFHLIMLSGKNRRSEIRKRKCREKKKQQQQQPQRVFFRLISVAVGK